MISCEHTSFQKVVGLLMYAIAYIRSPKIVFSYSIIIGYVKDFGSSRIGTKLDKTEP